MQNGRGTGDPCFQLISAGFLVHAYTCLKWDPALILFQPLFLSPPISLVLFFFSLQIPWLGILPCLIHDWHACFTYHVPTAMLCRPEGVSAMPARNLLTHGATSSQLSSPITLNSWNGPSPWHKVGCDHHVLQRGIRRELQHGIHVYVWREGNWLSAQCWGTEQIKAPLWIWQLLYSMQGRRARVTSTRCLTMELVQRWARHWKLRG